MDKHILTHKHFFTYINYDKDLKLYYGELENIKNIRKTPDEKHSYEKLKNKKIFISGSTLSKFKKEFLKKANKYKKEESIPNLHLKNLCEFRNVSTVSNSIATCLTDTIDCDTVNKIWDK